MGPKGTGYIRRVCEGLAIFAIVRGVYYALGERGIHPDLWVARTIDSAATIASGSTQAILWISSGILGLVGVFLLEKYVWPYLSARDGIAAITGSTTIGRRARKVSVATTAPEPPQKPALFKGIWMLNFNPNSQRGTKEISFLKSGMIGEGRNSNEHRWELRGQVLTIFRASGAIQNRFRYDPLRERFICMNEKIAEGIADQFIYRPSYPGADSREKITSEASTLYPLRKAAEEVYGRIKGTPAAAELIALGKTPSGIIKNVMWQLVRRGFAMGFVWPDMNDLVPISAEVCGGLTIINDNGDLGAMGETEPLILGLHIDRNGIERYVEYVQNISGKI